MRQCKTCKILLPFDSSFNVPKHYKAGRICKYCYKVDKNKQSHNRYKLNGYSNPDKVLNEPIKKTCTECPTTFWTGRYKKLTCCNECARLRKNRITKQYALNKKAA